MTGLLKRVVLMTGLAAVAACQTEPPDADPGTGLGEAFGGLLGESYAERLSRQTAEVERRCVDLGLKPEEVEFAHCTRIIAGTPNVNLERLTIRDDGRHPCVICLDRAWHDFLAYRATFVKKGGDAVEYWDLMQQFLARQRELIEDREQLPTVYSGTG